MDANTSLIEYIKAALEQGHEPAAIRADLSGIGWDTATIEASFKVASPLNLEIPLPPQPAAVEMPIVETAAVENISQPFVAEAPVMSQAPSASTQAKPFVDEGDQHKKVVRVIVTVGAILLGIGVYYFLALHWLEMAFVLRLAIIIISIVAAYASGWYLKEVSGLVKIGTALMFLGTLMYGAGIFLVGRMYGIEGYVAEGWTLWACGAGIVALVTGIFEYHYLTILLAIIAAFFELSLIQDVVLKDPANLVTAIVIALLLVITNYSALTMRRNLNPAANESM